MTMYLTAHRLRSQDGLTGINAFVYHHDDQPVERVFHADHHAEPGPGVPMKAHIELSPGGNFVDSYLDVVAEDSATANVVRRATEPIVDDLPATKTMERLICQLEDLSVRFYASRRIPGTPKEEFQQLRRVALSLFEDVADGGEPLLVVQRQMEEYTEYCLSETTLERLQDHTGRSYLTRCVTIRDAIAKDFIAVRGTSPVEDIALGLVDLEMFEIESLGGLVVCDEQTQETVWKSPGLKRTGHRYSE